MTTPITPADKFRLAQQLASKVAPMWAPVINQWEPKPQWGSKKLVVSGRQIKFDSLMPVEQLAAEIIHATDHFVMGHRHRRQDRDKGRWQTSACLETIKRWDKAIKEAGLEWAPNTDIRDEHPEIKRNEAEKVYDELQEKEGEPQQGEGEPQPGDLGDDDGQGQPGQGQPGQAQPGQPENGQPGEGDGVCRLEDNQYDESMLDELGKEGAGGEGEGDANGEGKPGDGKKPGPPGTKTGNKEFERTQEEDFLNLSRKIVKQLFKGADKRDYSLSKPSNRSSLTNGGILSSLTQKPEEVRIIIDVSGSVDDRMRNALFRVCEKIQRQVGTQKIIVALGDTEVKDVGPMSRVLSEARGGGGTAMEKVIPDAVRRMRTGSRYLIITDGETRKWPEKLPPNALVLIVNNKNPNTRTSSWYDIPPHIKKAMMWVTRDELLAGANLQRRTAPPPPRAPSRGIGI